MKKSSKRDFLAKRVLFSGFLAGVLFLYIPIVLKAQEQRQKQASSNVQKGAVSLDGFAGMDWGTKFSEVGENFRDLVSSEDANEKTEILNMERNKYILVRHNGLMYRYSFYKSPYSVARLRNKELLFAKYDEEEGEFFHVQLRLPPIESALLKTSLEEKYGKHQNSSINKKGFGALVWELENIFIFLWHEGYAGKSFVRRIDYLSAEHAKKIAKEYKEYFNAEEKLILRKLKLD